MRSRLFMIGPVAVGCLAACAARTASNDREPTSSSSAALTASIGRPRPIANPAASNRSQSSWQGSDGDLLLADAIAECSWYAGNGMNTDAFPAQEDPELNRVVGLMKTAAAACYTPTNPAGFAASGNIVQDWYKFRTTAACNYDPNIATQSPASGGAVVPLVQAPALIDYNAVSSVLATNYGYVCTNRPQLVQNTVDAFMRPSMNLCISHKVREQVNTTAAGDALFLTGYDQRMLIDTGRRLAQESTIEYAKLLEVASAPVAGGQFPPDGQGAQYCITALGSDPLLGFANCEISGATQPSVNEFLDLVRLELNYAGQTNMFSGTCNATPSMPDTLDLTTISRDFADATETLAYFGSDFLNVATRDRESHSPRGGAPKTVADDRWGPMGWQQRASAALYGGNALAYQLGNSSQAATDAPWGFGSGANNSGTIGWAPTLATRGQWVGTGWLWFWFQYGWPTQDESGYVRNALAAPNANMLLTVADTFNANVLNVKSGYAPTTQSTVGYAADQSCYQVDVASGNAYYNNVEAAMRAAQCGTWINCASLAPIQPDPTVAGAFAKYLLYTAYNVTPSDASAAVEMMRDALGPICQGHSDAPMNHAVDGALSWQTQGSQIKLARGSQLVARDETRVAGLYNRNAQFNLFNSSPIRGTTLFLNVDATTEGFGSVATISTPTVQATTIEEGAAGVNQALTAAKLAVIDAMEAIPTCGTAFNLGAPQYGTVTRTYCNPNVSQLLNNGYVNASDILANIGAQIGDQAIALRPYTKTSAATTPGNNAQVQVYPSGTSGWFDLDIVVPTNDPWWPSGSGWSKVKVYAIANQPWAADLANNPGSSYFGQTIAQFLATPSNLSASVQPMLAPTVIQAGAKQLQHAWVGLGLNQTTPSGQTADYWTLIAVNSNGTAPTYRVLIDGFRYAYSAANTNADVGYFHSSGGALGTKLESSAKLLARDRSRPALDAFGLPWDWVPPTNPDLYGATGQTTAAQHYLAQARDAAQRATDAANAAVTNMINASKDASLAAQEKQKAAQIQQNVTQSLCGTQDPSKCDTTFTTTSVANVLPGVGLPNVGTPTNPPWKPTTAQCMALLPGWTPDQVASYYNLDFLQHPQYAANDLWCYLAVTLGAQTIDVPTPVVSHLGDPITPAFPEYSGGTLQATFMGYWNGLKDVQNKFVNLTNVAAALDAANNVYQAQDYSQQLTYKTCEDQRSTNFVSGLFKMIGDMISMVTSEGATTMNFVADGYQVEESQYNDPCQATLNGAQAVTQAQAGLAYVQAQSSATQAMQALLSSIGNLRLLASTAKSALVQGRQAQSMATLEADLASAGTTTTSGAFRRYNEYDGWRAGALLDDARREAVIALRAIEAQYAVRLNTMTEPLPLVDSPSKWVDGIYGYDLSIAQTVGLDTIGKANNTINANQLVDYLDNLQRFIDSVPVAMPAARGTDTILYEVDGPLATAASGGGTPEAYRWELYCPNTSAWAKMPMFSAGSPPADATPACGGVAPTKARYTFYLDPVGNIDFGVPRQLTKQFNHRWQTLAANLVGTGIRDCAASPDPSCYTNPYLTANLSHYGPAPVMDFNGQKYPLLVAPDTIEGMKFLAAEEVLDPVTNGWSMPYVTQIARTELSERPLGGTYSFEIAVTPEVHLERIQRVQLLVGEAFWVREQ